MDHRRCQVPAVSAAASWQAGADEQALRLNFLLAHSANRRCVGSKMQPLSSAACSLQQRLPQAACPASERPCKRARTTWATAQCQMPARSPAPPAAAAEAAPAAAGRRAVLGLGASALLLALQPQLPSRAAAPAADLAPVTIRTELTPDWSLYDAMDPQVSGNTWRFSALFAICRLRLHPPYGSRPWHACPRSPRPRRAAARGGGDAAAGAQRRHGAGGGSAVDEDY